MKFKKDLMLLFLRVLLALLLLYTSREYLISCTRVFVHSWSFTLSISLLALNAVLFFYRLGLRNKVGLSLLLIYVANVACLFIDAAWIRYNGGIDASNSKIFFPLFYLNAMHGIIFILSFFESFIRKTFKI